MRSLTGSNIYETSDDKIFTPEWAVAKAAEINLKSVEQIKSLGIKIVGDIDRNDFSKIPTGINSPVKTISISTAARAMIGVDMHLITRMPGKALSKELFRRLKKKLKRRLHFK